MASPAAAGDWTQAYIGAGLGADVLTAQGQVLSGNGDAITGSAPIGGDLGISVTAGADYQIDQTFVAGAFVSYDWSNIDTGAVLTVGGDFDQRQFVQGQ